MRQSSENSSLTETSNPIFVQWIKDQWGVCFKCLRPGFDIQGSPERSLSRAVVEDSKGKLFLLEKFSRDQFYVKERVALTLEYLNDRGLFSALAGLPAMDGSRLPFFREACFQFTPFLDSTVIRRPAWLESAAMGNEMAGFLIRMNHASASIDEKITYPSFSIKTYIYKLFKDMDAHNREMLKRYQPVLSFLEKGFMEAHDTLPVQFCHGDFHPLNVIWDQERIRAVIDWEFTGVKPDCYDAANLVGCAGIEHPEGLAMPMVTTFLDRVKRGGIISSEGWRWFPEYIIALRFAWLSEWLRKQDEQMLKMEADFMGILIQNIDELREIWAIGEHGMENRF